MEEQEDNKKSVQLCQVCNENPAKYTCPGCNKKTCSLPCVRLHKKQDNCSGVRNRTKFVAMKDYTDAILQDDYAFLTDIARKVDSSMKGINDFPSWNVPHMVEDIQDQKPSKIKSYNSYMKTLVTQAEQRKTTLIVLPLGMTRQKENKTRYYFNKGLIMWHIKWILASTTPNLSFTSRCSELDQVGEALMNELSALSSHLYPLSAKYKEVGLSGLIIMLEKYNAYSDTQQPVTQQEFYIVPPEKSFREVFAGVTLLEYPVFHILFPSDLSNYSLVNLPLLPLPPWTPPEDKHPVESESKRVKLNSFVHSNKQLSN